MERLSCRVTYLPGVHSILRYAPLFRDAAALSAGLKTVAVGWPGGGEIVKTIDKQIDNTSTLSDTVMRWISESFYNNDSLHTPLSRHARKYFGAREPTDDHLIYYQVAPRSTWTSIPHEGPLPEADHCFLFLELKEGKGIGIFSG
eukprot:GHVU01073816.1.p1 GENE.GHVU01073816.1~~GHVU01073816.1.p1  ORF type:complete len:145 (-),score=4.03 GHVU01073816.1:1227-1661(-)